MKYERENSLERLFNIEVNKSWKMFAVLKKNEDTHPYEELAKDMMIDIKIIKMQGEAYGKKAELNAVMVYTTDYLLVELTKMAIVAGIMNLDYYKD